MLKGKIEFSFFHGALKTLSGPIYDFYVMKECDLVFFPTMHVLLSTHVSLKTQFSHPSPLRNVLFHSLSCNCAFLYPAQNLSQLYLECMYLCHFNETVISVKPKRKSQGNMDSHISLECKLFQDSWVFF